MPSRITVRNPYPVPDVSSEGFWLPPGPVLGGKVSVNDRDWSKKLDTHERLFAHHTLNSIRRDQRLVRNEEPNDALDLALTSTYVHNEDTLVPKMYVPMQPESLGRGTWRVLRNEIKASSLESGITIPGETNGSGGSVVGQTLQSGGSTVGQTLQSGGSTVGQTLQSGGSTVGQPGTGDIRHKVREKGASKQERGGNRSTATRAASAPHGSAHRAAGQLHRYAEKSNHPGIPDRIERIHPSSLKLAIEGPHTDQTNAGYSRKDDGTFYGV